MHLNILGFLDTRYYILCLIIIIIEQNINFRSLLGLHVRKMFLLKLLNLGYGHVILIFRV